MRNEIEVRIDALRQQLDNFSEESLLKGGLSQYFKAMFDIIFLEAENGLDIEEDAFKLAGSLRFPSFDPETAPRKIRKAMQSTVESAIKHIAAKDMQIIFEALDSKDALYSIVNFETIGNPHLPNPFLPVRFVNDIVHYLDTHTPAFDHETNNLDPQEQFEKLKQAYLDKIKDSEDNSKKTTLGKALPNTLVLYTLMDVIGYGYNHGFDVQNYCYEFTNLYTASEASETQGAFKQFVRTHSKDPFKTYPKNNRIAVLSALNQFGLLKSIIDASSTPDFVKDTIQTFLEERSEEHAPKEKPWVTIFHSPENGKQTNILSQHATLLNNGFSIKAPAARQTLRPL